MSFVPRIDLEALNKARRETDQVDCLAEGFTFKPHGRSGFVYYKQGNCVLEVYVEMSGVPQHDFLTWEDGFTSWVLPVAEKVDDSDQRRIRTEYEEWVKSNGWKTDM